MDDVPNREFGNNVRDARGKFAKGHRKTSPGRPKGARNKSTINAIELRQRLIDSWVRIGGDHLLDKWARTHFGEYVNVLSRLLPRQLEVDGIPDRLIVGLTPVGQQLVEEGARVQGVRNGLR